MDVLHAQMIIIAGLVKMDILQKNQKQNLEHMMQNVKNVLMDVKNVMMKLIASNAKKDIILREEMILMRIWSVKNVGKVVLIALTILNARNVMKDIIQQHLDFRIIV